MQGNSPFRAGVSLSDLAQFNERAVIHALRVLGPTSQAELAHNTGLAPQTVSPIVRGLLQRGLLQEARTESVGRGRPRVILELVASAREAIGIHVDPGCLNVTKIDLCGSVVRSLTSDTVYPDDPERTLDEVVRLVEAVQGSGEVLGAAIAVPGPIDVSRAAVSESLWLPGWTGYPLGSRLEERLGMRVPVMKDTVAAAIGENWVRAGKSHDAVLIYVYLGTGTGIGVSLFGDPFSGYSGNAGEIGQVLSTIGAAEHRGASAVANDPVLLVRAAHEQGVLTGEAPGIGALGLVESDLAALCAAGMHGDAVAREILEGAAQRIARMVLVAVELFDASLVVMGGPYWPLLEPFYGAAVRTALAAPSARGAHDVEVLPTALGTAVGAVGAAAAVLDELFVPRAPRRWDK